MRIAQIDTVYGIGSTGRIVQDIHNYLLKAGHKSKAYYGRGPLSADPGAIKISHDLEVHIDAGMSRLSGYTGIFSPVATKKLLLELDGFKPDVVHLHELHGYYVNYFKILEYLKEHRIPVVWTLHCEYAYTGRCGYAFDCDQWMTSCKKCPSLNGYPKSLIFDRSREQFERKKALITEFDLIEFAPVSNWLNNRLKQSFLKKMPASVVHNGVNTNEVFLPTDSTDIVKHHSLRDRYVVLSAAPDLMSPRKGGKWVLEVAKRLLDKPITFLMVGVLEKSIDCPPNVIFIPPITDQRLLAKYYSLADVFMITSQSETFSLMTAESLACGTPVVGFDSGGPSEVAPEPFGHFVPYANVDALASVVVKTFNGDLHVASDDCVRYARSNFSNDHMFQNYFRLYEKLINRQVLS